MEESLYTKFFKNKSSDEVEMLEFALRCSIPIENNLKAIQDRTEFLSEIIEYRFGIFFSKLFTDAKLTKYVLKQIISSNLTGYLP